MTRKRSVVLFIFQLALVLSLGLPAFAQVKITSVTPASAPRGAKVVIAGSGFSDNAQSDTVVFSTATGTVGASVTDASMTSLTAAVPSTAVTGKLFVQVGTSRSSNVTFTVVNLAPVANAGPAQTLPTTGGTLTGTATDDGLPNGTLTPTWTQVSGPDKATISSANAFSTKPTFPKWGTYVLRLTVTDGLLSSSSDVTITANAPPVVSASADRTSVVFPAGVSLSGTASDVDGLPNGTLQTTWSSASGPGVVTFSNPTGSNTMATFSTAGTYVLRLTATDSMLSSSSDVTINVNPTSFFVMAGGLNLTGQTNWYFYNGGDAPEGAYMGWLFQASTLSGSVQLPWPLPPGKYYVFFYGISYDNNDTMQAIIGGGTSPSVVLNDRDTNKYWSDRAVVDVSTASSSLQVLLTRNPAVTADQRYLFRGIYITDDSGITMTWDGIAVNLAYPTVMDDSAPVKGNLVPNGGFETPIDAGWGFIGQGAGRSVPINTMWNSTDCYEGQGCLKLTFDDATRILQTNSEEFLSRVYHLKPNKKYTVSMWMKTSGFSTTATVSLVDTFVPPPGYPAQHIVTTGPQTVTGTWTRISVSNYLLQYPTSDYQIDVKTNGASGNYLLIDAVQLEEGDLTDYAAAAPVEAGIFIDQSVKPGNMFYKDDVVQADMVTRNNNGLTPATATLRYEIYDQLNNLVTQGSLPRSLLAATTQRAAFNLSPAGKQGIFRLVTWIDNVDRTEREVVYSIIPRPPATTADSTSSLGIHPNYFDAQLKMLQRLGMKWSRVSSPSPFCRWSYIEPAEGVFTFYDAQVLLANTYGLSSMCTIGTNNYWPSWAADPNNNGLPDLTKWQTFVTQLVTHYKPLGLKTWEIWNEAYAVFSADFYARMLKLAADAIEAADSTATVVGMGGSPPDYIQAVIDSLQAQYPGWNWWQHITVLSSHDYPDGVAPEALRPLIDKYHVPVWNTEAGAWDLGFYQGVNSNFVSWGQSAWPHADGFRYYEGTIGASADVTENYLRTIATGLTKYFYYDSRYYAGPDYFKHHPTILEYDGTIRTKAISYAIAGSLIDHSTGLGNAATDSNSYLLVFDKASGPIAALFTADNSPRQITFSLSSSQFQVLDSMGNPIPGGTTIKYGRVPVYLKGISISASKLKSALQNGTITTASDTTPPKAVISDAPRGPIADHNFRVRWIAVDDTSYPNLGEINSRTNATIPPNPNAILYSYYLAGYSGSWSNWSAGTYVDFSNVPTGSYTFSVVAKDAAGNQSATVTRNIVIN